MRAKVISVMAVICFYVSILVGATVGFPALADSETAHWYEAVTFLIVVYGFIFALIVCAYHSIKWVLKEK